MKTPLATFSISLIIVGLYITFGAIPTTLIWHSDSPQLWQFLSAHLVHISPDHLLWNLAAFIVLASIIEQHSSKRLWLSLGVGCLFVNLYLLTFFDLPAYAGLSGVLNTLLVVALFQVAKIPGYRNAALISFIASIAKIIFEWLTATSLFSSLIWPSVPAAHLAGIIGGLYFCLILRQKNYAPKSLIDTNNQHS